MSLIGVPLREVAIEARKMMPEGMVMLKNDDMTLPLRAEDMVAVFGRCQINLYRSGTGSGGSVNVPYTTNLIDGLRDNRVNIDLELLKEYEDWIKENPYDDGGGTWASDPWFQAEMSISYSKCKYYSERNNKAIVVIGRTAGEDKDYSNEEGSYLLTKDERELLNNVCKAFGNVIVLLNVSNIIDTSYIHDLSSVKSIVYVWQGGMEGGMAMGDMLSGKVSPSGKLADTIAKSLADYPSDKYFYDKSEQFYGEDIYVGYRYFNTFARDRIIYPFGYGLTYSKFEYSFKNAHYDNEYVYVDVEVKNVGVYKAKEVMQLYLEAPNGKLGRASRALIDFKKTRELASNETDILSFRVAINDFKTYDDSGATGFKSSYVLEAGIYNIYIGSSSMDNRLVEFNEPLEIKKTVLVEKCHEASGPTKAFKRIKRVNDAIEYEDTPLYTVDLKKRIMDNLPNEIAYTGYKGIKLSDVKAGKASLDSFVAQLDDKHLAMLIRGEGMCNPRITPGLTSCFGGVSEDLIIDYGIPSCATSDGPSGIRMDVGAKATQLPIGTLIASSWNQELVEGLFYYEGLEVKRNEIDSLLGPGINIHRHPLNGRNFEYMSEDPILTGKIAAAESRGLNKAGVFATIKHMCCNNKETNRYYSDSIVSERALREIYLKAFEICVKEGGCKSIMTSYNLINGYYGQVTYDIITTILRNEWGYDGIVMTDWWALNNDVILKGKPTQYDLASMVRAQNDLYKVVDNYGAEININNDNLLDGLKSGKLTRAEMQRSVKNILGFIMKTNAMNRASASTGLKKIAPGNKGIKLSKGAYTVYIDMTMDGLQTAQGCTNVFLNDEFICAAISNGTNGRIIRKKVSRLSLEDGYYELSYKPTKKGVEIKNVDFIKD